MKKTIIILFIILLLPVISLISWITLYQSGENNFFFSTIDDLRKSKQQNGKHEIIISKIVVFCPEKTSNIKLKYNISRPRNIHISFVLPPKYHYQDYFSFLNTNLKGYALYFSSGEKQKIYKRKANWNEFFSQIDINIMNNNVEIQTY
ncbi:MAG: hypothetical protein PHS31_09805 [Victivallaceae bacterium]|nr:hypothetical protein [Victivallaceae bacterium]